MKHNRAVVLEKNFAAERQLQTRVGNLYNLLIQRLSIDWGRILDKSPSGLIKSIHKFAKSVTKTNSKMHKLKIYNKAINNLIYGNK